MALQDIYLRVGLTDADVVKIQRDFANLATRGGRDMNDAFRASFANTREILKSALRMDGNVGQSLAASVKTALSGATRVAEAEVARLTASLARTTNNGQKIQIERSLAIWQTELSNLSKHHAQINNMVASADEKNNAQHARALETQAGMDNRENARQERLLRQRVRMQNQARRDIEASNERQYQHEIKLAARTEAAQRRAYSRSLPGRFGDAALNTAVYGTIGAIGYYGRESVNRGLQREQGLAKVVAMSDASSPLGKMGSAMDIITDVANKTGMAASEVDALALAVAQAGISGKDASSVLLGLAQAMRLSFGELDAASAVRGFNVLRNTFYANEDAANKNAKAMYNLHEAIQMANSSASDAGQIVEAISKVSGAARMAKIDNKALEAILVTTQEISGTGAGTAATALRRTIPRLSAPETSEKMQGEYGIRYIDDNGDYLSKFKILEQIASKYRELIALGKEKRAEDLAQAAAGNVQYSTMSQVFVAMGQYHDLLKKLTDVEYNRDRQIIAANDNLQTSFTKMWNVLEKGGVALMRSGGEFNILKSGVDALSYSIGSISFDGMANGLALAALAAGGLAFKLAAVAAEQRALAALAPGGAGAGSAAAWGAGGAVAGAAGTVFTTATTIAAVAAGATALYQQVQLDRDEKRSSQTTAGASVSSQRIEDLATMLAIDKTQRVDVSIRNDIAAVLDQFFGKKPRASAEAAKNAVVASANAMRAPTFLGTVSGGFRSFIGDEVAPPKYIDPKAIDALEQAIAERKGITVDKVKEIIDGFGGVVRKESLNLAMGTNALMQAVAFSPVGVKKYVNNPAQRAKEAMDLLSSTKDLMLPAQTRLISGDTDAIQEMKGSRADATRAIEEIRKVKSLFGDEVSNDLVAKAELVYNQIVSDVVGAEKTQAATSNSNAKKAESKLKEAQNEAATKIVDNFSDQMSYFIGEMKKPSNLSVYTGEFKKLSNSILPNIEDMFGSLVNEDIKKIFKDKTRGGIALGASSLYSAMSYAGGLGGGDISRFGSPVSMDGYSKREMEIYDWQKEKESEKEALELQKNQSKAFRDMLEEVMSINKSTTEIAKERKKLSEFESNAGNMIASIMSGGSFSAGDLFGGLFKPLMQKSAGGLVQSLTRASVGGSRMSMDDIVGLMSGQVPEWLTKQNEVNAGRQYTGIAAGPMVAASGIPGMGIGNVLSTVIQNSGTKALGTKALSSQMTEKLLGSKTVAALGTIGNLVSYYGYIQAAGAILKSAGIGTDRIRQDDRSTVDSQNTLISDLFGNLKSKGTELTADDIRRVYGYTPSYSTAVKTKSRRGGIQGWLGGEDTSYTTDNAGAKSIEDLYKMTYDSIINSGTMELELKDNEIDQMYEKLSRGKTLISMLEVDKANLEKMATLEVDGMKLRQQIYDTTISGYISSVGLSSGRQAMYEISKKYGRALAPVNGIGGLDYSYNVAMSNMRNASSSARSVSFGEMLINWTSPTSATSSYSGTDVGLKYQKQIEQIFGKNLGIGYGAGDVKYSTPSYFDTVSGLTGLVSALDKTSRDSPEYDALIQLINIGSDILTVQQNMLQDQLATTSERIAQTDYLAGIESTNLQMQESEKNGGPKYSDFVKKYLGAGTVSYFAEEGIGPEGLPVSFIGERSTMMGDKYRFQQEAVAKRLSAITQFSGGAFSGSELLTNLFNADYIGGKLGSMESSLQPDAIASVKQWISELQSSMSSLMGSFVGGTKSSAANNEESKMYEVNSTGKYYITQNFKVESTYFGGSQAEAVQFLRFLSQAWNDSGVKNSGTKLF